MTRIRLLAFVGIIVSLAVAPAACRKEKPPSDNAGLPAEPASGKAATTGGGGSLVRFSLSLRVYPDMAVPGKEVVVEAEVVPKVVTDPPRIHFRTVSDPCDGLLQQEGSNAVYRVPPDCRGSGITIETIAVGSFGELRKSVTLDIKKTSFMESVVFTYPVPGQRVTSPIPVWWDRTLYHNRKEKLSFRVKRFGQFILETGELDAEAVVELDIPPSPEHVVLFGETTTGSQETAKLKVYARRVPEWNRQSLLIDSFALLDMNSLDAPRRALDEGGKCTLGLAYRVTDSGRTPFLFMHYHVSRAKRYGAKEAFIGIREKVTVSATAYAYKKLWVWLKGDPVRGPASPVHVRLEGNMGGGRTFKIKRLRDTWRPYYFPLERAIRKGKGEKLRWVLIYVDAKDVMPPMGTVLFGGLYLEPYPKPAAPEEPEPEEEPEEELE